MTTLTWTTEKRKVSELKAADYNPRKMTEKEERDLEESIEEFGAVVPVVVNIGKRKNILIGGHQRTRLYEKQGIKEIEVVVPSRELTKAEEKKLNLRLNKNVGSWDFDKLKEIDLTMLLEVGFGDDDLQTIYDDQEVIDDDFDVQRRVREIKQPITKMGDVWQLGDHRLMVGDSTKADDVEKLMAGEMADVIYCDPPYNIGLDYSKGIGTSGKYHGSYDAKKDSKKDMEYLEFVGSTLTNGLAHSRPNVHAFYWCDERYVWIMQRLFIENKLENKRVCLWIKNNMSPTPQVAFNKAYEPCVYATRGKPHLNKNVKNLNEILNKEITTGNNVHEEILEMTTLWLDKRDNTQQYEHPTQKPVTLAEKPLKRCSSPGQIVIDLFGGSGSTLIACEQLKRSARLMEMDPIFATVIIERWEHFTNKKAKKL